MKNLLNKKLVFLILLSLLSTACTSINSWFQQPTTSNGSQLQQPANYYLQMAATSTPPLTQKYQLLAVRRLLQDKNLESAKQILDQVASTNLPINIANERQLVLARYYLLNNNPTYCQQILQTLPGTIYLTKPQQVDFYGLLAKTYARNNETIKSIRERILLDNLLTQAKQQHNRKKLWQSLQQLDSKVLTSKLQDPNISNPLRGWLELATIFKQASQNPNAFWSELKTWREQNPTHPANSILPNDLNLTANNIPAMPKTIALLLPLTGKLANSGKAIRNGFLATFYQATKQQQTAANIKIINTADGIQAAYQNAINQDADIVVGPLTKNNIAKLLSNNAISIPTVALNTVNDYQNDSISKLYQFGLSPEDEAAFVAKKASTDNHKHAIVIAPNNSWGQRIANSFISTWQAQGGDIVANMAFSSKNYAKQIQQVLTIDQSQARTNKLKWVLKKKFKFVARRRLDFDMIFLVALPQQARQIHPLLKFYYAGNIPIYATSITYTGIINRTRDRDLDGIIFCDMPWVLEQQQLPASLSDLHKQITQLWHNSYYSYSKLYALGIDAYKLTNNLNILQTFPNLGLQGATGTLYIDQNRHIYRHLDWAQFRRGKANVLER